MNILTLAKQTKALAEKATPGNAWIERRSLPTRSGRIQEILKLMAPVDEGWIGELFLEGDAEFYAHSRTASPQLADAVIEMVEALKAIAYWDTRVSIVPTSALKVIGASAAATLSKLGVTEGE